MTQNIIQAGDTSNPMSTQGGDDGTLVLKVGPFGAKVNVGTFSSTGLAVTGALSATAPASTTAVTVSSPSGATSQNITQFTNSTNSAYASIVGAGSGSGISGWNNGAVIYEAVPTLGGNAVIGAYSGNLLFQTNARTTQATLDTSGNLGLGVTPSAWGGGYNAVQQKTYGSTYDWSGGTYGSANNTYYNGTNWIYRTTNFATRYEQSATGIHTWYTASSGTAGNAIAFTQSLQLGKGTALTLEGATSTAGTGIAFPATQLASTDPNTLDDYEEGTWVPSLGGTATYTTQVGTYTKIGRQVTASFEILVNAIGTGSTTGISGLPFTNGPQFGTVNIGYWTGLANSVLGVTGLVNSSATTITLYSPTVATVIIPATAIFGNTARVIGTATYFV